MECIQIQNGFNSKNTGKVQVFLSLAVLPKEISVIETSITLSCTETMTSYTFFANFSAKGRVLNVMSLCICFHSRFPCIHCIHCTALSVHCPSSYWFIFKIPITSPHEYSHSDSISLSLCAPSMYSTGRTWGWHRNLPIEELHSLFLLNEYDALTFRCQLTVTKIKSAASGPVLYRYPLPSFTVSSPHHRYQYSWRIQRDALRMMRQSPSGKMYESAVFGDLFVIQIYPNGVEHEGSVRVFVQMVAMPPGISRIEAKIELTAPQCGIRWLTVKQFSGTQTNWGWGDGLQSTESLYGLRGDDEVTFAATVEFIELYDDEGRALRNTAWNSSTVRALKVEAAQHDLEQTHLVAGYLRKYGMQRDALCNGIGTMISWFARNEVNGAQRAVFERTESAQLIRFKMHRSDPRFVSDVFAFCGLNWTLQSEVECESVYRVMLSLVSVPETLSEVMIGYNLFCPNNQSSVSGIRRFSDDDQGADRLRSDCLLVRSDDGGEEELVSFRVSIHVISVHDKYRDILYQFPSHLEWKLNPVSSLKKIQIRWSVDGEMVAAMKQSFFGQRFESGQVEDGLFCIGIAPNGLCHDDVENAGYCNVYLSLCSLPSDVFSLSAQWTLQCEELQIEHSEWRSHLDAHNALSAMFISTTNEFMESIHSVDEMTVTVEVQILQYLDTDGQFNRSFSHVSEQKSARTTRSGSLRRTSSARTSIEC